MKASGTWEQPAALEFFTRWWEERDEELGAEKRVSSTSSRILSVVPRSPRRQQDGDPVHPGPQHRHPPGHRLPFLPGLHVSQQTEGLSLRPTAPAADGLAQPGHGDAAHQPAQTGPPARVLLRKLSGGVGGGVRGAGMECQHKQVLLGGSRRQL